MNLYSIELILILIRLGPDAKPRASVPHIRNDIDIKSNTIGTEPNTFISENEQARIALEAQENGTGIMG
jgi:hypothetical protein